MNIYLSEMLKIWKCTPSSYLCPLWTSCLLQYATRSIHTVLLFLILLWVYYQFIVNWYNFSTHFVQMHAKCLRCFERHYSVWNIELHLFNLSTVCVSLIYIINHDVDPCYISSSTVPLHLLSLGFWLILHDSDIALIVYNPHIYAPASQTKTKRMIVTIYRVICDFRVFPLFYYIVYPFSIISCHIPYNIIYHFISYHISYQLSYHIFCWQKVCLSPSTSPRTDT